jgi:hypothetical protein
MGECRRGLPAWPTVAAAAREPERQCWCRPGAASAGADAAVEVGPGGMTRVSLEEM